MPLQILSLTPLAKKIVNRHPYRPSAELAHIGRFWTAKVDGANILAPRENQWFFIDTLLQKTGAPLIGIRSGALELPAVVGHNVIYLEDVNMFTPERHASWQGVLPYSRLMIGHPVGYENRNTEIQRSTLVDQLLSWNLAAQRDDRITEDTPDTRMALQNKIAEISDDIANGVMSTKELDLLAKMVDRSDSGDLISRTAMNLAKDL